MSLGLGDSVDGGGGLDMFDSGGEVAGVEAAEGKHENCDAAGGRKRARSAVDGDVSGGSAKFRKGQHEKACRLCCLRLTKEHFSGTKAECKSCHPDFEAARRDAIKQQELDLFNQICEQDEDLREFMADWKKNTPPSRGAGHKRGGYKFIRFKKRLCARRGVRRIKRKVMKTKTKFFDLQLGRGKDAPWCEKEWNRRRTGTTEWKTGQCRDTKLPTVQAYASSEEEEYSDEHVEDSVELETKQQAATKRNVAEAVKGLGEDTTVDDVVKGLRKGDWLEQLPEYADGKADEEEGPKASAADFVAKKAGLMPSASSRPAVVERSGAVAPPKSPSIKGKAKDKVDYQDLYNLVENARGQQSAAVDKLQLESDDLLNDLREALLEGQELAKADKACFEGRVKAMHIRLECLIHVSSGSVEEMDKHRAEVERSVVGKSEAEVAQLFPVPKVIFSGLKTLRELRAMSFRLGADASQEVELHAQVSNFEELLRLVNTMLAACRSSMKGLQSAKTAKEAFERSRTARITKQETAQKARDESAKMKAGAKGGPKKNGATSAFAVFDLDDTLTSKVKAWEGDDLKKPDSGADFSLPLIVRKSSLAQEVSDRGNIKVNSMVSRLGSSRA